MCPLNINLTSNSYHPVKTAKVVGNFHDYLFRNGMTVSLNKGVRTENINSCTAGIINAGKRNFMFRSAPEMESLRFLKKEIENQVNILRETCDKVKAFIIGGLELNNKDRESVQSFDLYNTIADTFDELNVPFAMMCGKKKGAPMEGIYAVNDNITVWSKLFKNLFTPENKKLKQDEIIDLLENNYQFIEVSPEQKISILGDSIAKDAVNLAC